MSEASERAIRKRQEEISDSLYATCGVLERNLKRAERERDEARLAAETNVPPDYHHMHHCPAETALAKARQNRDSWQEACNAMHQERDEARAALAEIRAKLEVIKEVVKGDMARASILLDAKDHWRERAEQAMAALAEARTTMQLAYDLIMEQGDGLEAANQLNRLLAGQEKP